MIRQESVKVLQVPLRCFVHLYCPRGPKQRITWESRHMRRLAQKCVRRVFRAETIHHHRFRRTRPVTHTNGISQVSTIKGAHKKLLPARQHYGVNEGLNHTVIPTGTRPALPHEIRFRMQRATDLLFPNSVTYQVRRSVLTPCCLS